MKIITEMPSINYSAKLNYKKSQMSKMKNFIINMPSFWVRKVEKFVVIMKNNNILKKNLALNLFQAPSNINFKTNL